ncbi:hypothetical protein NEOLI_000089 [Neolecta irregularis DAH-3]|uniref:Uncharacterized protein n=1 Tax=Neolecta irregularis (strain DAH-3) TaxID=1198029 RepID=A0A1U7LVF3_NEOID|nr:hypothetical protein NEOLI_000089 [Neolecta irregularis DAH-3]|eukprot:OLL26637.1 hypothetical protein NEOLI_000089 [Neolecta irregularis DAH-3]
MPSSEWACECFNIKLHLAGETNSVESQLSYQLDRHPTAEVPSLVSLNQEESGLVTAKCHNCGKLCFSVKVSQENPQLDDALGFFQRIDLTQKVTLLHVCRMSCFLEQEWQIYKGSKGFKALDNYINLPNYSEVYRILIPPRNVDSSSSTNPKDMHVSVHLQHRLSNAIKMKLDDIHQEISKFMKMKEEELETWSCNSREGAILLTERETQLNLQHEHSRKTASSSSIKFSDSAIDLNNAEKSKRSRLRSARTSSPSKGKKKRVSFSANLPKKSSQVDTDDDILSTSSSTASLTCNGGLSRIGSHHTESTPVVMEDEAVFDFDEEISQSKDCGSNPPTAVVSSGIRKSRRHNPSSPPYILPPSPLQPRTTSKYDIEEFDNETIESTDGAHVDNVPGISDNIAPRTILSVQGSSSTSELARSLPISIPSHSLPPPVGFSDEEASAKNILSTRKQSSKIEVARSFQERMMLEDNIDPTESIYDVPNGNWRSLG